MSDSHAHTCPVRRDLLLHLDEEQVKAARRRADPAASERSAESEKRYADALRDIRTYVLGRLGNEVGVPEEVGT